MDPLFGNTRAAQKQHNYSLKYSILPLFARFTFNFISFFGGEGESKIPQDLPNNKPNSVGDVILSFGEILLPITTTYADHVTYKPEYNRLFKLGKKNVF